MYSKFIWFFFALDYIWSYLYEYLQLIDLTVQIMCATFMPMIL